MSSGGVRPALILVALIVMTGLSVFLGLGLYARTLDAGIVEHTLREKNGIYLNLLARACPGSADWVEAYGKQGIAVVFRDYSAEKYGTFVGVDMSMVRSVLVRPDRAAEKFGGILGWFDENGCPLDI